MLCDLNFLQCRYKFIVNLFSVPLLLLLPLESGTQTTPTCTIAAAAVCAPRRRVEPLERIRRGS
jgi:hypothetical protein